LSEREYFESCGLEKNNPAGFSIAEIRTRLMKHPYVKDASVSEAVQGVARIVLTEKHFKCRVLTTNSTYLISEFNELIPVKRATALLDLPVVQFDYPVTRSSFTSGDLKKIQHAVFFLNATSIDSVNFASDISEIILKDNFVMYVSLTSVRPFIVLNGGQIERGAAYLLCLLLAKEQYQSILDGAEYLDLRLDKKILAVRAQPAGSVAI
jgi:hypothetical protein